MMKAEEAAILFATVSPRNYLAHSIREVEQYILREKGVNYKITTYICEQLSKSKCELFDNGCAIRIPVGLIEEERELRLRLAHELAHIIWNMDKLKNPESINPKGSDEEEIFAWCFAYHIIKAKSDMYQRKDYSKYVYKDKELGATIQRLVKDKNAIVQKKISECVPFTY